MWSEKSYSRILKNIFDVSLGHIQLFSIIKLSWYSLIAIISRNDFSPANKRKQKTMIARSCTIRSSIFLPSSLRSQAMAELPLFWGPGYPAITVKETSLKKHTCSQVSLPTAVCAA